MSLSSCESGGLDNQFWDNAQMQMEQHQYQIETEILIPGLYWHWNNAYASFVEKWPETYQGKNGAELVFSNRRWYPAAYGAFFWRDFDLDNKDYPGGHTTAYYDCDSHPYTKTELEDGSYKIQVDFLGYHWEGIMRPGEDIILTDGPDDVFRLKRLPAKNYDHSLDDLLEMARKSGPKRK